MIEIKRFTADLTLQWEEVLKNSFNGTFLHSRSFLSYHGERFEDCSVIGYKEGLPFFIFPANINNNEIYSHQGLSYGGIIFQSPPNAFISEECVRNLVNYYKNLGGKALHIKLIPDIYTGDQQVIPHSLIKLGAEKYRTDTVYALPLPISHTQRGKRWRVRNSQKREIQIEKSDSFKAFWEDVLTPNLISRHNVNPVHSVEEISLLAERHPKNILQFNVYHEGELLAGTTIFNTCKVAHAQYIASTEKGRKLKALDYLFFYLFHQVFHDKLYFSFGVAHYPDSMEMNTGLVQWKESYGAKPYGQSFYKLEI